MVCPFVFTTLQSDPRDLRPLRHLIREMRWHLWDICDKDNDIGQWHLTPITQWHLLKQSWLKVTPDNRQHSQLLQKSALFTVHERTCSRFTRLFVVRCLSPCPKYLINPYNAIFLKSQGSKDIKNDILDCQIHKYTNTNSQIHKYTNTAYDKMTTRFIAFVSKVYEKEVVEDAERLVFTMTWKHLLCELTAVSEVSWTSWKGVEIDQSCNVFLGKISQHMPL